MIDRNGVTKEWAYACIGKGWHSLIDAFYEKAEQNSFLVHIDCVKEKWGGLRIYWHIYGNMDFTHPEYKDLDSFLFELEKRSTIICEFCGNNGTMHKVRGWIKTLCSKCFEEREKR